MVLTIGITDVTFSNDTTKNLLVKTNPHGFFFERAKYEMNGIPTKVGDYGLRLAQLNPDGIGLAHYTFMRVTSNGENKPNTIYMTAGAVDRPYTFTIRD